MRFSNRAFGSKTTRNRAYHRWVFRIDTNRYTALIVPDLNFIPRQPLFCLELWLLSHGKTLLSQIVGRSRPGRVGWIVLFRSNFDFLVSKIGQE